ncbi:aldo/keto reductase [Streptomyces sp. HK10]|uniref:aldo/keto reductase n=1 Tax=Streptomyces sp. HK10 TaxID=3373255 RepID=UPI00374823C2
MSGDRQRLATAPLVAGCWSWGDRRTWGYGERFGDDELREVVAELTTVDAAYFDTAEIYGRGASERLLGRLAPDAAVSGKFFPYPWRCTYGQFARALHASLRRLRRPRMSLYQIHHDVPGALLKRWTDHLARARREGLIEQIGTSNLPPVTLAAVADRLAAQGEQVAAHQVRYNLCDRRVESDGTLELCRDRGIIVLAHSALGQGLLGGNYRPGHQPLGRRARHLTEPLLRQTQPVRDLLTRFGGRYGVSPAAVALSWLRGQGVVPVVGLRDGRQAREALAGCALRLPEDVRSTLDTVTAPWRGTP